MIKVITLLKRKPGLTREEFCELSADVRKSEKVSLRNPIMPITDDFGG
jgi:hypothetical protein